MPIKKNKNNYDNNTVEENLNFLQKRVNELVDRLETMEDDVERVTFVVALFSKYVQYYATKNNHIVDKSVIEKAIISTDVELEENYGEKPITDYEEEFIIAYLERIQERMFDLSDEERKRWV